MKIAAVLFFVLATVGMYWVVTQLYRRLRADLPSQAHQVAFVFIIGAWELSVGLVLWAWGNHDAAALSPSVVGAVVIVAGTVWVRYRYRHRGVDR